jgi:prohibitin 1
MTRFRERLDGYVARHELDIVVGLFVLALFLAFFWSRIVYTIPAGQVGVIWRRFEGGTDLCTTLGEGLRLAWPWDRIYIYDLKVQQKDQVLDVISKDGLLMKADLAYRFELYRQTVPLLHEFVGPDYASVLVGSDIAAHARDVFSQNTPQDIFSTRRYAIQEEIVKRVQGHLEQSFNPINLEVGPRQGASGPRSYQFCGTTVPFFRWVAIEDVLLRSIRMPKRVETAIEDKNIDRETLQSYDYRIQIANKEAARKLAEARGIRAFQDTITGGITEGFLRWKGIDATVDLAKSNNAKIVVVGSGRDGMPLILGGLDGTPATKIGDGSEASAHLAAVPLPKPSPTGSTVPRTSQFATLESKLKSLTHLGTLP